MTGVQCQGPLESGDLILAALTNLAKCLVSLHHWAASQYGLYLLLWILPDHFPEPNPNPSILGTIQYLSRKSASVFTRQSSVLLLFPLLVLSSSPTLSYCPVWRVAFRTNRVDGARERRKHAYTSPGLDGALVRHCTRYLFE